MAVYGFSVFLGFFPIAIYILIFFILITFKSFRDNYKLYYDAMFSGAMAIYLSIYYIALNYPEAIDSNGDRSLIMCILITLLLKGFLVAALSWMTAAAFWTFIKVKSDIVPPLPQYTQGSGSVRFEEPPEAYEEPQRLVFYRNINNRTMFMVTVATIILPGLHILIDIFSGNDADTINSGQKCWIGGGSGILMYVMIFFPALLAIVLSIFLYVWCGLTRDKAQFMSSKPNDGTVREVQLRIILVAGLGVWWLIEIPALAKASAGPIQHLNGLINIPLSCLAYYIFVYHTDEVEKTWDKHFPLGKKIKKEVQLFWKYYIYRPVRKQIYILQGKYKHRESTTSSHPGSPTSPGASNRTLEVEAEHQQRNGQRRQEEDIMVIQASHYSQEPAKEDDYKEFEDPNIYMNDVGDTPEYEPAYLTGEQQPRYDSEEAQQYVSDEVVAIPQYDTVSGDTISRTQDYDTVQDGGDSPMYIDPTDTDRHI